VQKVARPFFIGFAITFVGLGILEFPAGSAITVALKRLAALVLAPGGFFAAAISRGMLDSKSYYVAAFADVAFYTALAFLAWVIYERSRRQS
jgi:hypothetical protein